MQKHNMIGRCISHLFFNFFLSLQIPILTIWPIVILVNNTDLPIYCSGSNSKFFTYAKTSEVKMSSWLAAGYSPDANLPGNVAFAENSSLRG